MATSDLVPLFLADPAEDPEQPGIGKAWDIAAISSLILKTSVSLIIAASIVFAILSVGNPLVFFANVRASLVATSAPGDGTDQSMPIIQSTPGAQALQPTASEAPAGDEIDTAVRTADQSQTEIDQPPAESLLSKFQTWAAQEDARAQPMPVEPERDAEAQPVQQAQPAQDVRAQGVQNARAQVQPVQKQRQVRPAKQRQVRSMQKQRRVRPVQNAGEQDRAAQNAQEPRE
jgi:hypothetical protein